jgi:aspartate carbamoyltransferase catalytic subunit
MHFANQSIISIDQFCQEDIVQLFALAHRMRPIANREVRCQVLDGYILGSLFFEASTRTRLSFETAFMRLGGQLHSTTGVTFSSMAKGESLEDTMRVASSYCDIIAFRHPNKGSAHIASKYSQKPVINGGDGPGEHPTQALLDLFTIFEERGFVEDITITMIGDLKYGRTVHSLAKLLSLYKSIHIQLVAPNEVQMSTELVEYLTSRGCIITLHSDMTECLRKSDVIYMTRIQKERFESPNAYERVNGTYVLNRSIIETHCKRDVTIMHPLPRLAELSTDLDELPNAAYFRQAENGTLIRMALYLLVLGKESKFV